MRHLTRVRRAVRQPEEDTVVCGVCVSVSVPQVYTHTQTQNKAFFIRSLN